MPLQGRVAVVTGGTGALGRAVAVHLAALGASVHVPWIVKEEVEDCRSSLGSGFGLLTLHEANVAQEADVKRFFAAAGAGGRIDILVNIVGGFAYAGLGDTDLATWQRMLEVNATSCFLCCREALPYMEKAHGGRIVNVAAGPALKGGAAGMSAYGAAKAAVWNFTQALSQELVTKRITVNAIVPSIIDTPANRRAMPNADPAAWLPPARIAEVIEFLVLDASSIVTGSAINLSLG
ncbi:MAG: glucose-1-dehydrogenase [Planctomycetota bacterium]